MLKIARDLRHHKLRLALIRAIHLGQEFFRALFFENHHLFPYLPVSLFPYLPISLFTCFPISLFTADLFRIRNYCIRQAVFATKNTRRLQACGWNKFAELPWERRQG